MAWRSASVTPGTRAASTGRMTFAVRSPLNHPVENDQMTPAQRSGGSHRRSWPTLAKLGDDAVHELEDLLVELGVDEALDLLALRGVALAARLPRELRAREDVEELEHGRM